MKGGLGVTEKGDWIIFIPEKPIDYFYLGRISMRVRSRFEIRSNTDDPEEKLYEFKVPVEALVKALVYRPGIPPHEKEVD